MIDQLLSEVATYTMTCIFMSCVWGFTPLAVPLICMAGTTGGTQITFDTYLTSHIYRVGATVSIRHDFQPPGLLIQTSQRRVIQTPLMMCFLVHSHLESTQNGMQTGRPAVHRSRNIIIRRPSTITGLDWWTDTKNHFYAPNEIYSPARLHDASY